MLLLLLGMVGQLIALRLLVIQLARFPDDPPLVRRAHSARDREHRERRHRRLTSAAIVGFTGSTALAGIGVLLLLTT